MRYGMTPGQAKLMEFLREHMQKNDGIAPSYEEIMVAIGLNSKSGVHRMIHGLVERGLIRKISNRSRSIVIVDGAQEAADLVGALVGADVSLIVVAAAEDFCRIHGLALKGLIEHAISDYIIRRGHHVPVDHGVRP